MVSAPRNFPASSVDLMTAAPDGRAYLTVSDLDLSLGDRVVLNDVAFELRAGEMLGIYGAAGSGKSTLIRCLSGLQRPDRGTLRVRDNERGESRNGWVPSLRAVLGVVLQDPCLDQATNVLENLLMSAALFGVPDLDAKQRAEELLTFMQLAAHAKEPVHTLNADLRKRLEIIRALIHKPNVLLLDEPTRDLDLQAAQRTWQLLHTLRHERALSLILCTEQSREAEHCDRLLLLDRGHIVTTGTPKDLLHHCPPELISMEVADLKSATQILRDEMNLHPRKSGPLLHLEVEEGEVWAKAILEKFPPGLLLNMNLRRATLADVAQRLTGIRAVESDAS